MQVNYRSVTPALNPRRTKLEVPGGAASAASKRRGRWSRPVALPPVFGRRSLRDRVVLPVRERTAREHAPGEGKACCRGRFRARAGKGRRRVPPFRAFGDLYYTISCRLISKGGAGAVRFRAAPRFYTDPTATTPIAGPSAHPQMVADGLCPWCFKSTALREKPHVQFREPFGANPPYCPRRPPFDPRSDVGTKRRERELQSRRIFPKPQYASAEK